MVGFANGRTYFGIPKHDGFLDEFLFVDNDGYLALKKEG